MGTFDNTPMSEDQIARVNAIRSAFNVVETQVTLACKNGRQCSLALTKLDEACMWAVKSISRE